MPPPAPPPPAHSSQAQRALVVNADDAGVDAARNEGIIEAFERGLVRSASALVNFPAFDEIAAFARARHDFGLGLHFNLSEGTPLASGHRTLVGSDGRFQGKEEFWRLAEAGELEPEEVAAELAAQWARFLASGLTPTHLDGHHHAHVSPPAVAALAEAAPMGLRWIRLPLEVHARRPANRADTPPGTGDAVAGTGGLLLSAAEVERPARAAAERWRGRFRWADAFLGIALGKAFSLAGLLETLSGLRASRSELMTHPGRAGGPAAVAFSRSAARETELRALTDPAALEHVERLGLRLANFRDWS
ncbi:MAG: ChbG/HpnK family deacetylase [Planctomycetes bacterium]|nr:ChbG/HpnK family deacetylase [Planctomycetota bacterium]